MGTLATVVARAEQPTSQPAAETPAEAPKEKKDGRVNLLEDKEFFSHWTHFAAEEGTKREDTWELVTLEEKKGEKETILRCTGAPFGYLRSKEPYQNCEIGLEWRFPKTATGNSGILVFVEGKDTIWPMSIGIQFHSPEVGKVFPVGGGKCQSQLPGKMLSREVNQWNSCKITCRDGSVSVVMNGQNLGQVRGCMPAKGFIALQSQGAEVHFRNIWKADLPQKPDDQKK